MLNEHEKTGQAGDSFLDAIDPDIQKRLTSRRGLFFREAVKKIGVAATAPAVLALASKEALGQALPGSVQEILTFALTLEYLEAEFYSIGLSKGGLIPAKHRPAFSQIRKHEVAHVRLLKAALGPAAIASPRFDFTAKGQFPDVFSNFGTFATVSSTFEDLGVAAYKGQAPFLLGTPTLTTALRIHSVEARHAAEVRRIRGVLGFDGATDAPLSKSEVLAAAGPFIVG